MFFKETYENVPKPNRFFAQPIKKAKKPGSGGRYSTVPNKQVGRNKSP